MVYLVKTIFSNNRIEFMDCKTMIFVLMMGILFASNLIIWLHWIHGSSSELTDALKNWNL